MIRLTIPLVCVLFLASCSDEQVRQAVAAANTAKQTVAVATAAVDEARRLVAVYGGESASRALVQAEQGLAVAKAATERAEAAANAAQEAQDAGSGTIELLLAAAAAAGVPIAGWLSAFLRSRRLGKAFEQTVEGVQAAREAVGEEVWKGKVAPALASAQDEAVKKSVSTITDK